MRLNRYLASAGLGSRRGVEEMIKEGRVRVNGQVVTDLATQVEETDSVKVGSRLIRAQQSLSVAVYKPRGYVVTARDEKDRRTIFDLLPSTWPRVFHVGRLDKESEGLLILTNDDDLSLSLTHPKYKVEKEYEVEVDKPFDPSLREKLLRGFHIIGGRAKMEAIRTVSPQLLRVVLLQGLKRQIRHMLYEVGYEVVSLKRVRVGEVQLGTLQPGEWRLLSQREIASLRGEPSAPDAKSAPKKSA